MFLKTLKEFRSPSVNIFKVIERLLWEKLRQKIKWLLKLRYLELKRYYKKTFNKEREKVTWCVNCKDMIDVEYNEYSRENSFQRKKRHMAQLIRNKVKWWDTYRNYLYSLGLFRDLANFLKYNLEVQIR